MKKIAILQSNYIPWKGYFDIINMVDEFIIYDDVKYTLHDWRNRNKIITPQGVVWLTVPVETKGKFFQKINEAKVRDNRWASKHWETLRHSYIRTKGFAEYGERIKSVYEELGDEPYLSKINHRFLVEICDILGIDTTITWSSDYHLIDGKTERLVALVREAGGDCYLSGPAAKDYLAEEQFAAAGIKLEWMDYSGYREYAQRSEKFVHEVSIVDLIFNEGKDARFYLKSVEG